MDDSYVPPMGIVSKNSETLYPVTITIPTGIPAGEQDKIKEINNWLATNQSSYQGKTIKHVWDKMPYGDTNPRPVRIARYEFIYWFHDKNDAFEFTIRFK